MLKIFQVTLGKMLNYLRARQNRFLKSIIYAIIILFNDGVFLMNARTRLVVQ